MATLIEVNIEANEPWTAGQRIAFDTAVMEYVESNLNVAEYAGSANFDADAQLTANGAGYIGWGANAHDDADGPVFDDSNAAQRFADIVRSHVCNLGMTVKQFTL